MSNGLWVTPEELGEDVADSDFAEAACETASFLLWGMSGRKFSGLFSITELYTPYVPEVNLLGLSTQLASPDIQLASGDPFVKVSPSRAKLRLRSRPVLNINEIKFTDTGDVLSDTAYDLFDHATVYFDFPLTREVEISYDYGTLPPVAGKMAARHLARQFVFLWDGREELCDLPDRVMSVTRQGVSWVLLDNQSFLDDLRTGVYTVDLFLKTVNPDKARNPSKVFSPDIPIGRRKTPHIP